ncbi:hypothetical protein RF11_15156 [Thelohanellus kitauei]|uniref:Uncharacterized protein n=1 Tax=Thelohanellus kitauei TaxID=669202 RepID=A0A0C2N109_THEKT|nr:hypothetical protein RF11_15156 [Thelohanellus kitauei]
MSNTRYKPTTTLVRKQGRHMSLSLSRETDVFKSRTVKEKKIWTDSLLVEIRIDGVGHLQLHMEEKGRCRHCKESIIRYFCGKCGVYIRLTPTNRNFFFDYHTMQ